MQFLRYQHDSGVQWGVLSESTVYSLSSLPADRSTLASIANPSYRSLVDRHVRRDALYPVPLADVRPLAPVARPGQIVCVGLNYADHATEQGIDPPERPKLFSKSPSAVTNPGAPVAIPRDVDQVDHEVELAVVVGRTASDVTAAEAGNYVAGYTVLNDISARDALATDGQNFRGKSYPTFAPMGPTLSTEPAFDPGAADIACRVNGITRQSSNTAEMIFGVGALVEYVSGITTLQPGDVIATGTPGGVGAHRTPPEFLEPGDKIEAEISGIGVLETPVVNE